MVLIPSGRKFIAYLQGPRVKADRVVAHLYQTLGSAGGRNEFVGRDQDRGTLGGHSHAKTL